MVFNWKAVCFISHWHHLADKNEQALLWEYGLGTGCSPNPCKKNISTFHMLLLDIHCCS